MGVGVGARIIKPSISVLFDTLWADSIFEQFNITSYNIALLPLFKRMNIDKMCVLCFQYLIIFN